MAFEEFESIRLSTAPSKILEQIRASILDGSLAPGTQLNEKQLAERLAISRGPVREALQRLIQEGLLRSEPHRGTFVVELDADDFADIYLARRAVEHTAVIRLLRWKGADVDAATAALDTALHDMQAAADATDERAMISADMRFHQILVDAAGSKRLTRMYRTLVAEALLCLSSLADQHPRWRTAALPEHVELLDALRSRDEAEVLRLLDAHFVLDESLSYRGVMSDDLDLSRSRLGAIESNQPV